jgi:hypothetical protein
MRRFVALLAFAALAACGDSTSPDSVTGTYTLRTVNGSPLPYPVLQSSADTIEITSDMISLNDGGKFAELGTARSTQNGVVTTSTIADAGTYTVTGTAIILVSAQFGSISGSVSGGTLTRTTQGLVAVFQK